MVSLLTNIPQIPPIFLKRDNINNSNNMEDFESVTSSARLFWCLVRLRPAKQTLSPSTSLFSSSTLDDETFHTDGGENN